MERDISFEPAHRLSESLLRASRNPEARRFKVSSLAWLDRLEGELTVEGVLASALDIVRSEASEAALKMPEALDDALTQREREKAAFGVSFKAACCASVWEFAQWRSTPGEGLKENETLSDSMRKKLDAIGVVAGMALGSLGVLVENLSAPDKSLTLIWAKRTDEMLGFLFCQESLIQWRVLEERRQLNEETTREPAASPAPKSAAHRV